MIDFIMTNLPIIVCFVLGIGLLIMEALMPGFGIAGFSGIALEVVALVLTWQQHGTMATLGMLLIVLSVLAIAISTSLHSLTKGKLSKSSIVNSHTESTDAGYRSAEDMQVFLGREGTATTALRPTGLGEFDGCKDAAHDRHDHAGTIRNDDGISRVLPLSCSTLRWSPPKPWTCRASRSNAAPSPRRADAPIPGPFVCCC